MCGAVATDAHADEGELNYLAGPVLGIAAGYRYTGVHELYVTPKVGTGPSICID